MNWLLCVLLVGAVPYTPDSIVSRVQTNPRTEIPKLWDELKITPEADLFDLDRNPTFPVSVRVLPFDLDGDGHEDAVIELSNRWDYQFLVFLATDGWRFVGNIDLPGQKYDPPTLRLEPSVASPQWLVVRRLAGSGTGFLRHGDNWFDVSPDGLREVLWIPVSGSVCATQPLAGNSTHR